MREFPGRVELMKWLISLSRHCFCKTFQAMLSRHEHMLVLTSFICHGGHFHLVASCQQSEVASKNGSSGYSRSHTMTSPQQRTNHVSSSYLEAPLSVAAFLSVTFGIYYIVSAPPMRVCNLPFFLFFGPT